MGVNDGGGGGGQSAPRRERRLFQEIEETPPGETISNIRLALTLLDTGLGPKIAVLSILSLKERHISCSRTSH